MSRNYRGFLSKGNIVIPRWMAVLILVIVIFWLGLRIMSSPAWIVQRLDSPDGERSARLMRTEYIRHHFKIQIREGFFWQTVFMSDPIDDDYRVDHRERLNWSSDSTRLFFAIQGEPVWGYDFTERRRMDVNELEIDDQDAGGQLH